MNKTKPFPLPIAGVDTLSEETAIPRGAVRAATNVDIGRAGRFARRDGYVRRVAIPGMHSLFYSIQRGWTLVASSSVLNRLDTGSYALAPLYDLNSPAQLEYTEVNGNLYFASRSSFGWVPAGEQQARPVGVPVPQAPTLAAAPGGLTAGKYAVAITLVDDRGEEGGASEVGIVDLPNGGGVRLSDLPQRAGWQVYVYMTPPDGDMMHFVAAFPAVFPTYVAAETARGGKLETQHLVPLPPGDFVRWHSGRIFTASGSVLRFSEPMRPHLHNPAHGVIPFTGVVAFVESVGNGLFVGDAHGVWYLSGNDPAKFEARRVSTCRAVPRSSLMVAPEHLPKDEVQSPAPVAVWLSTSGYVVGLPGGETVELQPDRLKVPSGLVGRSAFLLRDGRKQVITPVNSTSTATYGTAVDSQIP